MQAEQIAKALGNAKKVNGSWLASCPLPTHGQGNGDKNPSLSISDGPDGKPLFKCHGGCDQHDVFAAIRDYGLLPDLEPRAELLASIKPLSQPVLENEWHYTDEDGVTLFIKQRYKTNDSKGKTYKQLRVDEHGRRHASITGAKIVPYNLPEVEEARTNNRTVFLTEGEKAADALKTIGVVATCTHQGASSFPEDAIQYFAGLNVVILPDNDKVGWEYAKKAVKALKNVTNSIRVVELPLEEVKEDAYEYVNRYGYDKHDLVRLAIKTDKITSEDDVTIPERFIEQEEKATEPQEDTQIQLQRQPFKIEQLDDIDDEPVEWLIEGVIPKKAFVALYAPPASFKSFVALDIAECIATGREFLTKEVKHQGAVLYIAGEGHGGIGARIKAMKKLHNTPAGAPVFFLRKQINLRSSATDIQDLIQAVDDIQATHDINFEMVVIDTLARAFGGGNENASEDMGAFITAAGAIQGRYNCALLVVHHAGKDATKGLRGHSSLLGAVDTELEIIRIEDAPKGILHISKQKDGEDGQRYGFQMITVELSTTLIGFDSITSLAVQVDNEMDVNRPNASPPPDRSGSGHNQRLALTALHSAIKKFGMMENIDGTRSTSGERNSKQNLAAMWNHKHLTKHGLG
jgi:AAA domain